MKPELSERYRKLLDELRPCTGKLIEICANELTRANHHCGWDSEIVQPVEISLDRYMQICGIPDTDIDKKIARLSVETALDILSTASIAWTEYRGKMLRNFEMRHICTSTGIRKGYIRITFTNEMARYLEDNLRKEYLSKHQGKTRERH